MSLNGIGCGSRGHGLFNLQHRPSEPSERKHSKCVNLWSAPKKAEAMKQPGHRKRGQTATKMERLCKEGCKKAQEDDKWREKVADRERWKGRTAGVFG